MLGQRRRRFAYGGVLKATFPERAIESQNIVCVVYVHKMVNQI